jgi:hypothetical protein
MGLRQTERGKIVGLSFAYPARLVIWVLDAPSSVWWSVLTILVNALAVAFAWLWGPGPSQLHENLVRTLGAALQCAGVLGVALGVFQTRNHFRRHLLEKPVSNWFSRRPELWRRRRDVVVAPLTGSLNIALGDVSVRATSSLSGATVEEKLTALHNAIEAIRLDVAALRKEAVLREQATVSALKADLNQKAEAAAKAVEEAKQLLVSHATGGLNLSFNGTICLFVGVLLGTLPYSAF